MKRLYFPLLAALLIAGAHCKDSASDSKEAKGPGATSASAPATPNASSPASSAAWRKVAAKPRSGELDDAYDALVDLKRMTPQNAAAVTAVLDKLAVESATPEGLLAAGEIVAANEAAGADPTWAGSGTSPAASALHAGTMAVFRGIVGRAAERARGDADAAVALIKAIRKVKLAPLFNSGGRTSDDRDRSRLHIEARGVLGDEAFEAALKRAGS